MESLYFFPTVTNEMLEACGLTAENYKFFYTYRNNVYALQQKGNANIKLTDPLDIWEVETEGLTISKSVQIAYPELLKGASGVVCQDAEFDLCIIWTNRKLTQTGYILPEKGIKSSQGYSYKFKHTFDPGTITGDLELDLVMYVKKAAESILPGEENLINEVGVTVGELEKVLVDFNDIYMDFPIEECCSDKEPLWWVVFSDWEDPETSDMFTEENICLYLNTYYEACPAPSANAETNGVKNFDMLVDILAQTYFLMFRKLEKSQLENTIKGTNLMPNSICSILNQFIQNCIYDEIELYFGSDQDLLKSLQINIRGMLQEDSV